jgi:hypothetical protein
MIPNVIIKIVTNIEKILEIISKISIPLNVITLNEGITGLIKPKTIWIKAIKAGHG